MDDKDFQAFCSELKKETPDMAIIRNGMEKYGMDAFSDAQKAEFLQKLFPQNSINNSDRGFQNTTGIRNTLTAMQQLQAEGKVDGAHMKSFLTETNPKGGANVVTTLALNIKAAESKLSAKKNGAPVIKKASSRQSLKQNLDAMVASLETLALVEPAILQEALNTADKTSKQGSFKDYAAKSAVLSGFLKKLPAPAPEKSSREAEAVPVAPAAPAALTIEAQPEEPAVQFGGMENDGNNTLTISPKPQPLNVKAKTDDKQDTDPEDEKKKIANLKNSGPDSTRGKSNFDFEPIREQDIIQFMLNTWIYGAINGFSKWLCKKIDNGIDKLCTHFDSGPSSSASASQAADNQTPAAGNANPQAQNETPDAGSDRHAFLRQMDRLANNTADHYQNTFHINDMLQSQDTRTYVQKLIGDIQNNIGKDPSKWNTLVLTADKDKPFMEKMEELCSSKPNEFKETLKELAKQPEKVVPEDIVTRIRLSAQLATVDFAAQNIGKDLDNNAKAEKAVRKNTFAKMTDLQKTAQQIGKLQEIDFRKEHGIAPEAKLSAEQQTQLAKIVDDAVNAHLQAVSEGAYNLKNLMNSHYLETDTKTKKNLEKQIAAQYKELTKLQNKYLSGDNEQAQDGSKPKSQKPEKKLDLREAAQEDIRGQQLEQQWHGTVAASHEQLNARMEENAGRKHQVEKAKRRSRTPDNTRTTGTRTTETRGL